MHKPGDHNSVHGLPFHRLLTLHSVDSSFLSVEKKLNIPVQNIGARVESLGVYKNKRQRDLVVMVGISVGVLQTSAEKWKVSWDGAEKVEILTIVCPDSLST